MKKPFKKLNKYLSKIIKKFREENLPKIENILLVFLFSFCIFFGLVMFGIGEQIRNEKDVVLDTAPVIDQELAKMVSGTPMEKMLPYLSSRDEQEASFLVAIAKKESNWGKFSPKKDGRECYNYWGYRGKENRTESGYSCFKSPRQAVAVVGARIGELIDQQVDTPGKMIVWKCGSNCAAAGGQAAANKWVSDVGYYYKKLYN